MAGQTTKKRKKKRTKSALRRAVTTISILAAILALLVGFFSAGDEIKDFFGLGDETETADAEEKDSTETSGSENEPGDPGDPGDPGNVEFHFIDAGQGDAAIIRTPDNRVVLVDTSTGSFEAGLKMYLQSQGITTIDYAVFTHPDEDHIGGADMIMKEFDVKHVLIPSFTKTTKTFRNMMEAIEASDAELIIPDPGYTFSLGDLKMEVLAPLKEYKDANESSIVFRADYGDTSVLFTGDAEGKSEGDMLSQYGDGGKLDCDLLKVGHHGSRTSSSLAFIEAVSPQYAVISCGTGNDYGHPHGETLSRLANAGIEVSRTDREGTIIFISDGKSLQKQTGN